VSRAPGRIFLIVRYSVPQKEYTLRRIDPRFPPLYPAARMMDLLKKAFGEKIRRVKEALC
jgi:hypothetical protein